MFSHHQTGVQKMVLEHISVNLYQKKTGTVVLVALIAHHKPTLMSRNGTLWIKMGLFQTSAHYSERPLRINPASSMNSTSVSCV
jgi:hypothetical protein